MFEQSIVTTERSYRSWSVAVSLVLQTGLILGAAIIPLIYTDRLPALTQWAQNLVVPSPPPAAPSRVEVSAVRRVAHADHIFTAPITIPRRVAIVNDLNQPVLEVSADAMASGPFEIAGPVNRLLADIIPAPRLPEPPRPVPPTRVERAPMRVSAGVQEAKLLRRVIPVYPPLAITTRTEGTVHLVGVIAKDGTIRDLQVIDGHPLLVRAAIDAVKQWIYKPTLLSGEPVEVIAPIEVRFTLNR